MANWFSCSMVGHYPHDLKQKEVDRWGGCSHVQGDVSLLYAISYENDSFGREGHCICEDCYRQARTRRDEEKVSCHDCRRIFTRKDVLTWSECDAIPSEGDVPIHVCGNCQTKELHLQRVRCDDQTRRDLFPHDDLG